MFHESIYESVRFLSIGFSRSMTLPRHEARHDLKRRLILEGFVVHDALISCPRVSDATLIVQPGAENSRVRTHH